MDKVLRKFKEYGIIGIIVKVIKIIFFRIYKFFFAIEIANVRFRKKIFLRRRYQEIKKIVLDKKYENVYVFYPYTEWNLPIFQRPQQIALELSNNDKNLYLFCTANQRYDKVDMISKVKDNLYLTTEYDYIMKLKSKNKILHLYSTDTVSRYSEVEKALKNGSRVLYEYIDEIHEEITHSLPDYYLKKHKKILKNEKVYVVGTAEKIYIDIEKNRKKNYTLATNGVTLDDFKSKNIKLPKDLKPIKESYDKVITYYGALATWFDYDLLKECAKKYPKYAFVLLGMEYDDTFKNSNVTKIDNVFYLGKVNYKELVNYAKNSDLLTIPFKINEITESTSPVKLFEYMAAEVPILTTDMRECRKYKSVNIGKDHEDYIEKIPKVIAMKKDKKYVELERIEAEENTWAKKVEAIEELISK